MRLLKRSDDGNLSLTEDLIGDKEVPTYAILSHTWQDGQEVTFDDWTKGNAKSKVGYEKIRFCAQQAERDGLYHFWVDTCCINKADPVELQDAINSMFRWYKGAAKCYVYLSDVSTTKQKAGSESPELTWEPTFRASRWFTRGWTLQELVAPLSVDFFSQEGEHLGDKQSLEQLIQEITGIPISALRGAALQGFSVDKRLKWAKNRQTTRKEDKAYCLMGLFGIFLPLIYGEGEDHAFKRLQDEIYKATNSLSQRQHSGLMSKEDQECVKSLRLTDPSHDKSRIEETKGGLLKDTYRWVLHHNDFQEWRDSEHGQLLWIKGDPGKGKTMLLCGIIDELRKSMAKTNLLSYFFCQATDSSINNSTAVLRGLLYMLVSQQPLLVSYVRDKYDHAGGALFNDANTWAALTEIFTNMLQDPSLDNAYLIIDALDECTTDLSKLLNFVAKQSSASSRVKWLVSSRNWPDIEEQLERAGHKVRLSLELNAKSVSTAVTIFIKQKVLRLAQRKRYDKQTQDAIQEHLRSNANNTFLWVALVCQNLEASSKRNVLKKLDMFPPGLDSLYERMMQQINKLEDDAELCKQVLALITLVYRPITLQELAVLVKDIGDDLESLQEIVGLCGSFLTLREETVYFVHQSAKDFLLIQAAKDVFPSGKEGVHHIIFARSLDFMSRTLQRDMYGLNALGCLIEAVKPQNPDPLAALAYSCIYWIDHLCDSKMSSSASKSLQDGGIVDVFLKEKFLYWLEGLSLCKSMPKGIVSMTNLWLLVQVRFRQSI
jgi:archaellum biogenesis ATPase FlaH